jgi:serine/threonine protein kinase/Tfp pilus assembly protein PilF
MNEETLFELALNTPPNELSALLERECEGNPVLRERVEKLLAAHWASSETLVPHANKSAFVANAMGDPFSMPLISTNAKIGTVLGGKYKLTQSIGKGGMGEVWMAEQEHPVRRRVALKLIKFGLNSQQSIARFEAERQALAMMDHPNIAKVFDGGTTPEGQPYFVMEFVNGIGLTEYCNENKLSINERLRLFVDVCNAVQHAHHKGVIHRDLKPSNVMVGQQDGQPVPKVIDFGLAKAVECSQRLTDQSSFTSIGQILGTLKYMSPEQANLNNMDIDTRCDIYALGVMLYELLTGSTPLEDSTIKGQATLKLLELIRDQEPVKPSSRLSCSEEEQISSISSQRRTDSARLHRVLAGDLDWIVMKALEKDRTRRYDSASGFAADIQRYLNSEPVIARPPSVSYRVRKFVRKHRFSVVAGSLVALALIGGILGTSLALVRALKAENDAIALREEESKQRQKAEQAQQLAEDRRQEAETNLAFARKGNSILGSVFAGLDPNAKYQEVSDLRNALRDNLEQAVKELQDSAIDDPVSVAEMLDTLGLSLLGLGESLKAIELFEHSLKTRSEKQGADHKDTLNSMNNLSVSYYRAGQLDKALPLYEQTLERRKAVLGADHLDTMKSMSNLAAGYQAIGRWDKSLPLLEQTLELVKAKLGPEHLDTLISMNNLAAAYRAAGLLDKAFPLFEETLALMKTSLGSNHPTTLTIAGNLATTFQNAGQMNKALPLYEETLDQKKAQLGLDHPDTLVTMNSLASGYKQVGQMDKALPLYKQTLELRKARLGPDHPDTLNSMNNLAVGYQTAGQLNDAVPLFEKTLEIRKAKLAPDHPDTLQSMGNLATCYQEINRLDQALPLHEKTLEMKRVKLGPDHPQTLMSMNNLAMAYRAANQMDKALPLLEQSMEVTKAKLGNDHPSALMSMNNLASAYQAAGQLDKAMPMYEQTLELRRTKLGPDHPDTLGSMNNLAFGYQATGQLDKAVPLYEQTMEALKAKLGPDNPNVLPIMSNLLAAYASAGETVKYDQLFNLALAKWRKTYPTDGLLLAGVLARAGFNSLVMKRPKEAETLLRESLNISQARQPENWITFRIRSMLGEALIGQHSEASDEADRLKLLDEAEQLLVSGYEGMKQREAAIPVSDAMQIPEALDRLISLYTILDKPNDSKKYRELKAFYPPSVKE